MRVPKLRGFKRPFKVDYEVVNVGRISAYAEAGRFAEAEQALQRAGFASGDAPLTVNAELMRAVGLISRIRRPVKVLGSGEVTQRLFVVADAFTNSAREKLEAAGGVAQVMEVPTSRPGRAGVTGGGAPAPAEEAREAPETSQACTAAASSEAVDETNAIPAAAAGETPSGDVGAADADAADATAPTADPAASRDESE